jgi:hypothetical protein
MSYEHQKSPPGTCHAGAAYRGGLVALDDPGAPYSLCHYLFANGRHYRVYFLSPTTMTSNQEWVRQQLANAPKLSDEQKKRLALLLRPCTSEENQKRPA